MTNLLLKLSSTFCSAFAFAVGFICFCMLSQTELNFPMDNDEGSLILGQVTEKFEDTAYLHQYFRKVSELYRGNDSEVQKWLSNELHMIGLDVYDQKFSFQHSTMFPTKELHGSNLYAIMRSPSGGRTEAILITVPMMDNCMRSDSCYIGSISIVLAALRLFRTQHYWAKDIIVVFPKFDFIGWLAWIDAYHGTKTSPGIRWSELEGRSGNIQAGLNLEFKQLNPRSIEVLPESINGLLPNLDLPSAIISLAEKQRFPVLINGQGRNRMDHFYGFLRGVRAQATGSATGLHGLLLKYQIPAVTIRGPSLHDHTDSGGPSVTAAPKLLEGALRSLNNLQRRLLRNSYYYILPSHTRTVSLSLYIGPVLIMICSLLFKPMRFLMQQLLILNESSSDSHSLQSATNIVLPRSVGNLPKHLDDDPDQLIRQRKPQQHLEPDRQQSRQEPSSRGASKLKEIATDQPIPPVFCCCWTWVITAGCCGLLLYGVPKLVLTMTESVLGRVWISYLLKRFQWTIGDLLTTSILICFGLLVIITPFIGFLLKRFTVGSQHADFRLVKFIIACMWALFLGNLSALNVSMCVVLTLHIVPLLLFYNMDKIRRPRWATFLHALFWLAIASPPSVILIGCIAEKWNDSMLSGSELWDILKRCVTQGLIESDLLGSWSWYILNIFGSLWIMTWIDLCCS